MADVETVTIPTSDEHGSRISQHGESMPNEATEVTRFRQGERIIPMPNLPVQTIQVGKRTISEAARERVAKIMEARQLAEAKGRRGAAGRADPSPTSDDAGSTATGSTTTVETAPATTQTIEVSSKGRIDPNAADPAPVEIDDDPDAPPGTADPAHAAAPSTAAPQPAEPEEVAQLRATIDRQARLLEQRRVDREQRRSESDRAAQQRAEALADAESRYVTDPVGSVKKMVAAVLGAKDMSDPAVRAEMQDLISDLTADHLSAPLDPAYQGNRKATLTDRRVKLAEERFRARDQAEQGQRTKDAETSRALGFQNEHIAPAIKDRTKYPSLHLASHLDKDGRSPERIVYDAIDRGIRNGTIDPNTPIESAIARAAAAEETFYRSRAESLRSALNPGTAAPAKAPSASQRTDGQPSGGDAAASRRGHGSRTITTADASVAPATSTAQPPANGQRPKFRNDAERRAWVVKKHFPDHPAAKPRR